MIEVRCFWMREACAEYDGTRQRTWRVKICTVVDSDAHAVEELTAEPACESQKRNSAKRKEQCDGHR